ncbi:biosynthetic-type acetolactate synthase large subunit [Gallintestinimicrobium sp.]|uniref:biosynthetic-type acetolactate synthase large subunit n=1 Tax=Gallintestinimicrobium sp. TaxID=2981655 RepID=UPI0030773AE9
MNGAQAMVKCLENEGVEMVFGYPGVAICPFYDSLLDTDIKSVLIRTEQNAAHAASGLARVTGKVGVCAVTSGPGATNLITGIATAFADSIPLVCITGQVNSELIGSDVFQEADITGAAESFVKYSYLVKNAEDIPQIFKEAFYIANTGRKGPVLIDVPIDVQNAPVRKFKYPDSVSMRTYKPTVKGHIVQIKKVIAELEEAKRPVICAGGGVLLGDAQKLLREFSHRHKIPVVTTMMGIGAMQTEDPLYFGMVGNNGAPCANRAMNEADMIIMVGARVADRAVNQPEIITKNKVLVHMDVDPAEIGKNAGPTIPLVGDAKHIFSDMLEQELDGDYSEWVVCLQEYEKTMTDTRKPDPAFVDPAEFVRRLSDKMEQDAVYVADVGQNQIWSCRNCKIREGSFLTSGGMGTMGYSIPAAMGAKLGAPGRQVVAVCGDGSFQMSMMEFATMRQYQVPVKIVVIANHYLGMVREYQQNTYKGRYSVVELGGGPDLEKLAQAYGMDFIRLEAPDKMDEAIDAFLKDEDAVLMECVINPMDTVK